MTALTLPKCPKCGGESEAPARAGMSFTPYRCMTCAHAFGLLAVPFSFQPHEASLGHTVVVGPAGKGMSVMSDALREELIEAGGAVQVIDKGQSRS